MSGHSHWATIKHKKGAVDAKRGKLWSKLSRAIIIAASNGGGDPTMNLKLRYAIDKAREVSMPKDNIERAIKRGTGDIGRADLRGDHLRGDRPRRLLRPRRRPHRQPQPHRRRRSARSSNAPAARWARPGPPATSSNARGSSASRARPPMRTRSWPSCSMPGPTT